MPLGISLIQLTITSEEQMPEQARQLIERVQQEETSLLLRNEIIEVITTIAVYKLANLSREEVEAMLGLTLEETRVYQEAKAEGRLEGREEGRLEGRKEEGLAIVLRLLTRRFSTLESSLEEQIQQLSSVQLADLSEALLDFSATEDLVAWLQAHPPIEAENVIKNSGTDD